MIYTYEDNYGGVALIDAWGDDARAAHAARVSFSKDGESSEVTDRDERLIKFMLREKHTSPFEHSGLTMKVICPLFVRSQIMRHRTFSFNEVSRRYTAEDIRIYTPTELRLQADKNLQCSIEGSNVDKEDECLNDINACHRACLGMYEMLLRRGVSREQARGVLPQNTYTMFWMTGNLHNWFKFLKLRLDVHTQPETRLIAEAMWRHIESRFPVTTSLATGIVANQETEDRLH